VATLGVTWVMLNPSTADALQDDPTIRRCVSFSKREGFGGLVVCNLFTVRATNPSGLLKMDPDRWWDDRGSADLDGALVEGGPIIVGWGSHKSTKTDVGADAVKALKGLGRGRLQCLGTNKDGSPKHPLYLGSAVPLVGWP